MKSPRLLWNQRWRNYRHAYAEARENDLCERDYDYPDYPAKLNRGKFEWQPRHPHLILNIKTQDRFTISDARYCDLFPIDNNWWNTVGRKFSLGHYICTGHLLLEESP